MCMIDDAERVAFCSTTIRTARKTHVCTECRRIIQIGETYTYSAYGFEGSVGTNKSCSHCQAATNWLYRHCGGACFGAVKEDLIEHYDSGYREDGLEALVVGIRRKWKDLQGDGLLPVSHLEEKAIAPIL
jgi:hypothetical protein